jgi:hypothetical protein
VTIDSLPDEALLEIFKFYVDDPDLKNFDLEVRFDVWHTLVHVCQRWRRIVFSSPRHLNLQLLCMYARPVTEMDNIWPELPIAVVGNGKPTVDETENFVAALKLNHRVSRIDLWDVPDLTLERFAAATMEVQFPALTELVIWSDKLNESRRPILSDQFLGGSAPRLQWLWSDGIPFPALPRLLLSTTDLVTLCLEDIPHSGYISPEDMVACLPALTRLDRLFLGFRSPRSHPSQASRHPRPPTRAILPALTYLKFRGVTEYLEDFVARINAPLLRTVLITFLNQLVFDIVQLPKFLNRIDGFAMVDSADVVLRADAIRISLSTQSLTVGTTSFELGVSCRKLDWQLSSLSQLCASTLSTLSELEHLDISEHRYSKPEWQDDIENIQWLELLHSFSTVKNLSLSQQVVPRVAPALQQLARERITEVLPTLQVLILDEFGLSVPAQEALREFIAAREHSGYPVGILLR